MTSSQQTTDPGIAEGPKGVGGWMILPIAGMSFTLFGTGRNLWQITDNPELIRAYAAAIDKYSSLEFLGLLSIGGGLVLMFLAACALLAIVLKTPRAPILSQLFFLAVLMNAGLEAYLAREMSIRFAVPSDATTLYALAGAVIYAAIWIPYFRLSKRVRNTFRTG